MSASSSPGWGTILLVAVGLLLSSRACSSSDEIVQDLPYAEPVIAPAETPSNDGFEFHGYECTTDCSGHEAGYDWAEEQGIENEDDCEGNSESFIEGCKAFVQENADATDEPDESGT